MQVLVGWTDSKWNHPKLHILEPILEAFGFQTVTMDIEPTTQAFEAELSNQIEQCDGVISFNVPPEVNDRSLTWPMRALASAEARQLKHLLLIRWKGDREGYPARVVIDWDSSDPTESVIKMARELGGWRTNLKWRFELSPHALISELLRANGSRIMASYRVRTSSGDLTRWKGAESVVIRERIEVLVPPPSGGSQIGLRLVAGLRQFESELTAIDRCVMELKEVVATRDPIDLDIARSSGIQSIVEVLRS